MRGWVTFPGTLEVFQLYCSTAVTLIRPWLRECFCLFAIQSDAKWDGQKLNKKEHSTCKLTFCDLNKLPVKEGERKWSCLVKGLSTFLEKKQSKWD